MLADVEGRAQVVPVAKGVAAEGDSLRRLSVSSMSSVASAEMADGRVEAVALSHDGKVVALVLKTRCLLKCVAEGVVLGEMSLLGTPLCKGDKEEETDALLEVFSSVVRSEMFVLQTMALWSGAWCYGVAVALLQCTELWLAPHPLSLRQCVKFLTSCLCKERDRKLSFAS